MTECIMTIQILKDLNGRMHNGYTSFPGSELQNA